MTQDEINHLVAINEAVAHKLGFYQEPAVSGERLVWKKDGIAYADLPSFCADIRTAWEIVEKYPFIPDGTCEAWFQLMRRQEHEMIPEIKTWEAGWARYDDCMILSAYSDSAPMAICLAFLKLENK